MSFEVDIGYASQRGPRSCNEDWGGAKRGEDGDASRGVIAAVADGVSSGGLGLEAAQTTVMALLADYFATPAHWETTVALDRLIGAQNAWLADHNRRRAGQGTALTTLSALVLRGQTWTVAHVGDTRAWLIRDDGQGPKLSQLTQDHAFDHPDQRSRLTRAIGLDDGLRVDYLQGEVQVGDTFVLTTDGIHGRLGPREIARLAGTTPAELAAQELVRAALEAGGQDNASALVIRVTAVDTRQLEDEQALGRRLPVPPALRVGEVLDGYTITGRVADNGIHLLYQARQTNGRLVALKTLHPSRANDPQERAMLAHEAWLGQHVTAGLDGGFVRVLPHPVEQSAFYVAFDWHQGRTLEQLMADGRHPGVAEVVAAACEWTRAIGRLHRQGVVHRDVKPGNLHLGDDGIWRLLDLGVAISGREPDVQRELHAGTPSYMNPEQWDEGGTADSGSDLFALAVTLYQWLTAQLPYGDIAPYQKARFRRDPVPASRLRPDVPIWLDHLLAKALARDAAQRFETADELLLALERGAARPLAAPPSTPLIRRDPAAALRLALGLSLGLNTLLILWLFFLPR